MSQKGPGVAGPAAPRPKPRAAAGSAARRAYQPPAADGGPAFLDVEAATFGADDGLGAALAGGAPLAEDAGDAGAAGGEGPLTPEMRAMAEECLPLVKFIAHRIAERVPKNIEVDELMGVGAMGLLSAAQHFDPARGAKFRTFAEPRIRGAILDYLRSLDWVPRSLRQKQKDIEDAIHVLSMRRGRAVSDEEVAEHLGVPLADFHKSLDDLKGISLGSFEDASGEGEGLLAYIADPDADDPHLILHREEMKDLLARLVDELPEQERLVVGMYYYSDEEMNMKEIGRVLDVTESRVSQIHSKAILTLRGKLRRRTAA